MEAKRQHCTRGWHGRKDPLLLPFNSSTYSLTFLTPQLSFSESFPRQVLLYEWKWFHCPACQQQKTHLVTHHPLEWKDPSLWQKTSFLLTITKKQQKTASPDGIICYKKDRYFKDNSVCSHAATQPAWGRGQCKGDGPLRQPCFPSMPWGRLTQPAELGSGVGRGVLHCASSLPSVCLACSLAGPQSPPGNLQITSVFDYSCLQHLIMSICGTIKESPGPVLLCHAEMKLCQRLSTAVQPVTQHTAETQCVGASNVVLGQGNVELQWVAERYPAQTHSHQRSPTFLLWNLFPFMCIKRHICVINVSSFLENSCSPRSERCWLSGWSEEFLQRLRISPIWCWKHEAAGPSVPCSGANLLCNSFQLEQCLLQGEGGQWGWKAETAVKYHGMYLCHNSN